MYARATRTIRLPEWKCAVRNEAWPLRINRPMTSWSTIKSADSRPSTMSSAFMGRTDLSWEIKDQPATALVAVCEAGQRKCVMGVRNRIDFRARTSWRIANRGDFVTQGVGATAVVTTPLGGVWPDGVSSSVHS